MSASQQHAAANCRICGDKLSDPVSAHAGVCYRCGAGATPAPHQSVPGNTPSAMIGTGMVLGKCEITRELGRGGMGTVYLAHHRTLDVPVAVKVLSPEVARVSPQAAERFLREARLTARIRHPNLVGVMDTDTDPVTGCSYLVMEYVDGPSVSGLICGGAMDPADAVRIIVGVSRALDAAVQHKVIHRDIKPGNILVASDGTVKLTDLGLAKDLDFQGQLTASSATLGTPLYMSPEQIKKTAMDIRTDIYSLGVTLFEMLTGKPPYTGYSFYEIAELITTAPVCDPRDWRPDLDARLCAIVMRMMAKLPEERFSLPADVTRALGNWLGETPSEGAVMRVMSFSGVNRSSTGPGSSRPSLTAVPPVSAGPQRIALGPNPHAQTLDSHPPAASAPPASHAPGGRSNAVIIAGALAVIAVAALLIVRPELFRVPGAAVVSPAPSTQPPPDKAQGDGQSVQPPLPAILRGVRTQRPRLR